MSSANPTNTPPGKSTGAHVSPASARVVDPFAVKCRFDRARGEFVVHAGARAGACAAVAVAVLAIGTFAFARNFLRAAPVALAAAADVVVAEPPVQSIAEPVIKPIAEEPPSVTATPKSPGEYVRTPGLNYLVVRSLPTERAAVRERETLNHKGVATTVERNLPGWSKKGGYSLVGMTGFDLERDRKLYDRHVKELKAMKLEPKPYKWRATAD